MEMLTPRERQFMLLMLDGHTNKDIADLVGVTADNIKKYRAHILEKMGVDSLPELIVLCREAGIALDKGQSQHHALEQTGNAHGT